MWASARNQTFSQSDILRKPLLKTRWYPRPDSNRHASRRGILNPLRLPFRHLGTWGDVACKSAWGKWIFTMLLHSVALDLGRAPW